MFKSLSELLSPLFRYMAPGETTSNSDIEPVKLSSFGDDLTFLSFF
jgi:hypothetical protein